MCQSKKYEAPESIIWNEYCARRKDLLSVSAYVDREKENISKPGLPIDIWSLGCVLLELYTSEQPFSSVSLKDLNQRVSTSCISVGLF